MKQEIKEERHEIVKKRIWLAQKLLETLRFLCFGCTNFRWPKDLDFLVKC